WLSPAAGFAFWTGLNFLAALYLAWRVAQRFPTRDRWWVGLLVLTSFPVVSALAGGQVQLLMVCAFTECYLSLRAGLDFRGGLWLACLIFKPQYGILLGPILLWKRRWAAVAGSILGTLAILGASMLGAGIPAFLASPSTLLVQSDFSGSAEPLTAPYLMTNGRGLVLRLLPGLADEPRMLLTLVLSAVI